MRTRLRPARASPARDRRLHGSGSPPPWTRAPPATAPAGPTGRAMFRATAARSAQIALTQQGRPPSIAARFGKLS